MIRVTYLISLAIQWAIVTVVLRPCRPTRAPRPRSEHASSKARRLRLLWRQSARRLTTSRAHAILTTISPAAVCKAIQDMSRLRTRRSGCSWSCRLAARFEQTGRVRIWSLCRSFQREIFERSFPGRDAGHESSSFSPRFGRVVARLAFHTATRPSHINGTSFFQWRKGLPFSLRRCGPIRSVVFIHKVSAGFLSSAGRVPSHLEDANQFAQPCSNNFCGATCKYHARCSYDLAVAVF